MVPEKEMDMILNATGAYRSWSKFFIKERYPQIKRIFTEMYSPERKGLKVPGRNYFSLDDRCEFSGREYTVRQLIAQMRRGSRVGMEFAEAVYKQVPSQPSIIDAIEDDGTIFCMGQTQIPSHLGVQVLMRVLGIGPYIQLLRYTTAIYRVTHPKVK